MAGQVYLLAALAVLAVVFAGLRWVARRSEEKGARRALVEQGRRTEDAEKELARKLHGGDSAIDAHIRVRRPGGWGKGPSA
jgi:hypothetical protein